MKKLLLFIATINFCFAQVPVCNLPPSYKANAHDLLKNLDKTQISTGVLYENVYPMAEVEFYTGQINTDTTNSEHFKQAWDELYQSTYNNTGKKHFTDLENDIESFNINGKYHHPVGIIDYQYNTIKSDAVSTNLLNIQNGKLYDTPNRPTTPYLNKVAALASILLTDEFPCFYPGQHFLYFNSNFVLSNTGFSLMNVNFLTIKINTIPIYSQAINGIDDLAIPIFIANDGLNRIIEIYITIGNETKKYIINTCQYITEQSNVCKGQDEIQITGYPYDGGYPKGLHSEKGVANIYYSNASCPSRQLQKVIIFVDGFDATNEQHHEGIWQDYLNKEFTENNQIKKLGNELISNGYDVVILDQKKNAK
jgi:hypothetical protein